METINERCSSNTLILLASFGVTLACQPVKRPLADADALAAASGGSTAGVVATTQSTSAGSPNGSSNGNVEDPASTVTGLTNRGVAASGVDSTCASDAGTCSTIERRDAGAAGSVTCPGCLIDGGCVAVNALNPSNPCQICDPSRDAHAWAPRDTVACDDGLFCTVNDVCTGGVCKGSPRQCEDGIACNGVSTCDEAAGKCTDPMNQCGTNSICDATTDTCVSSCGGCLVGGVCVATGVTAAGNPCQVCDPSRSTSGFSAATDGVSCDDRLFCTVSDHCQGGTCVGGGPRNCGNNSDCNESTLSCVIQLPPSCGDGILNGNEVCDSGGSGSTALGACNPECSGFYTKKFIKRTQNLYSTNLGGISGADQICQREFDAGWKALLVGTGRRATITPFVGDGQLDWVLQKYTYYFNINNQLVWRTDDVALLGASGGAQQNIFADLFDPGPLGNYPWSGYAPDWTTLPDQAGQGTCESWTVDSLPLVGSFIVPDLSTAAEEPCGTMSFILCVQQ